MTNNECGGVLTDSSQYISSVDANGDGLYDDGQHCQWTIRLGVTQVVVFEVLKIDIYATQQCEFDFLEVIVNSNGNIDVCLPLFIYQFTYPNNIQSTLVISTSVISNNRISRGEKSSPCLYI